MTFLFKVLPLPTTSALPQGFKGAILLLYWIMSQYQKSQKSQEFHLNKVSILQDGPNRLRDKKRRNAALKILEDHLNSTFGDC